VRPTESLLGHDLPSLLLPVRPAGNMATLVEGAARDHPPPAPGRGGGAPPRRARPRGGPAPVMRDTRVVFVAGLSGSGRSTAMDALEDAGFYSVAQPPPP